MADTQPTHTDTGEEPIDAADKEDTLVSRKGETESEVQKRVEMVFGGAHVKCDAGIADVVTDTELIEVKRMQFWSDGVGQLLKYKASFPERNMILYLFGEQSAKLNIANIQSVCQGCNIQLLFDGVDYDRLYVEYMAKKSKDVMDLHEAALAQECLVYERSSDNTLDLQEFRVWQERIMQGLRYSSHAVRFISPYNGPTAGRLLSIYQEFNLAIGHLQEYMDEGNSDIRVAEAFIHDVLIIDGTSDIPTYEFRQALKAWCNESNRPAYTKYIPAIGKLLASQRVVFDCSRKGRKWIGIRLKGAEEKTGKKPTIASDP